MNQLLRRLEQKKDTLTSSERAVGLWLERHPNAVAFLTTNRLAREAQVSEATIVRFARKLEYKNYSEMQRALQIELEPQLPVEAHLRASVAAATRSDVLERTYQQDIENLRRTYETLDRRAFARSVDALANAKRVGIIGLRASAGTAIYLAFALNLIRPNVFYVRFDLDNAFDQLLDFGADDVILAISLARPAQRTLQVLYTASQRCDVPIVAITNSRLSPVGTLTNDLLLASIEGKFYNFTAIMSLCHALLEGVASLLKEEARERLVRLEALQKENDVLVSRKVP